jgi:hypothetical protein
LEKYGIYTYSDFESLYQEVPIQVLENFVEELEAEIEAIENKEDDLI